MADPAPTPAPAPEAKTKRTRSPINRKYLDEIKNSRAVAAAAVDSANTAALTAVDFDATLPAQITTLADATESKLGKLTGTRAVKDEMSAQEQTAHDALLAVIAPIQTAARRKFTGDSEKLRQAYFIGTGLAGETLSEVQAASIAIRDRLVGTPPQDVLPGIGATQITALSNAITKYASNVTAPDDQENENTGALGNIAANISTLAGLRHQVQLAAEQAFPYRNPGVASIRKSFLLPGDRPMPG
jgi:hypothetical protein